LIFKAYFILLLLICSEVKSFDKDFKIDSERIPTEFTLLFNSMKIEINLPKEKIQMVGLIEQLGENLSTLNKEHVFLLFKSEVIKNVLEHQFDKVRQFDMTTLLVERLHKDYEEKKKYLNPFSQWVWRSILAELRHREKNGIITSKSFNPRSFQGTKLTEALRFQKYLHYILPWIDRMDSLDAPQFNQLTKEVSWIILRRINERSILFKRFASTLSSDKEVRLFNIPQRLLNIHPEEFKRMQMAPTELSLKEKSQQARDEAQESMDNISHDDMSTLSDEVMDAIDSSITPPVEQP
jgi:hypothetical protein